MLMPRLVFSGLWDDLLAEGTWAFTLNDLATRTRSSHASARVAVHKAARRGVLVSPSRGVYVIVPAQDRISGTVPIEAFLDRLMHHLGRSYYLSYLTAATHFSAHSPTTERFQVTVDSQTRLRDWQGIAIECCTDQRATRRPTQDLVTRWGTLPIATAETLAYDLVTRPERVGGIAEGARIIAELELGPTELTSQFQARTHAATRRLGWLLDLSGHSEPADALHATLRTPPAHPIPLDPSREPAGPIDSRWHVRVNSDLADAAPTADAK